MIQDVNFHTASENLLPVDKRGAGFKAWLRALLYPLTWAMEVNYNYRNGTTIAWDLITVYAKWDTVTYFDGCVYKSLEDGNVANQPDATPQWAMILTDVVGTEERKKYNSTKLILEYALNKRYGALFFNPPSVSDIYIETVSDDYPCFIVGPTESTSSGVGATDSTGYVQDNLTLNQNNSFIIHFPVFKYAAVVGGEETIRQFVDKYVISGITYTIVTY